PAAQGPAAVPHAHCDPPEAQRSASGPHTAHPGPHPDALVEAAPASHPDQVPPGWQVCTPTRHAPAAACWHACACPGAHARSWTANDRLPERPAVSDAVAVSVTWVPAPWSGVPRSSPVARSTESHAGPEIAHAYGGAPSLASSRSPYGVPTTASASFSVTT